MNPVSDLIVQTLLGAAMELASSVARAVSNRDAAVLRELAAMEGVCCQFEGSGTIAPLEFQLAIEAGELRFRRERLSVPQVIVHGSAQALLHALWPQTVPAPKQDPLRIDGDERVLLALQALAAKYRPDPVDKLADSIGEEATARILGLFDLGWRGVRSLAEAVSEEIGRQSRASFVHSSDLEALLQRTDALRLRIDRLDARTRQLESSRADGVTAADDS